MRLGFVIPIVGACYQQRHWSERVCRGLEDVGYDTLWVGDQLVTQWTRSEQNRSKAA